MASNGAHVFVCVFRFVDEQRLANSANVIIVADGFSHKLHLKDVQLDQAGPVVVRAVNVAGEMTASASLRVKGSHGC